MRIRDRRTESLPAPVALSGAGPHRLRDAAAALACGVVAMLWYLRGAARSYTYDESVTVGLFVDADWLTPFDSQLVANNHPLFSFASQLVWRLGGTSETWMRVLPALFAAAAVAAVVGWCAQRWGLLPGLSAGFVLATNPLFVHYGGHARGYSMVVLCGIVATIIVLSMLQDRAEPSRRREIGYILVAAAGLATHLYMGLVLAGHVGLVHARRGLSLAWFMRWTWISAIAVVGYLGALPARRSGSFRPWFPVTTAWEVLGGNLGSVMVLGFVCVVALWAHRRDATAFLLPLLLIAVIWAVLRPFDLYARFFVIIVPAVAVAGGWAVSRRRWLAAPILLVSAVATPLGHPPDSGLRDTAAFLTSVVADGGTACAHGSEALIAYVDVPELTTEPNCDVVAVIGSWESAALADARQRLRVVTELGDVEILRR